MLVLKLSRIGKKKYPTYRLIVIEKMRDPFGRYLEKLGSYNPHTKVAQLNVERIKYWLSCGAQQSATVHNLLISQNVISGEKVRASKSRPGKKKRAKLESEKAATETAKSAPSATKPNNQVEESGNIKQAEPTKAVPEKAEN